MNRTDAEPDASPVLTSVAFCGGASGGHVTPALAIAEEVVLRFPDVAIHWLGSSRDVERRMLAECREFEIRVSEVAPARPLSFRRQPIMSLGNLLRGVRAARFVLAAARPDVVVGSGGYASVPGVLAAASLRIPVVLFEPNAIVGRANRALSRLAAEMLTAMPVTGDSRVRCRMTPVGIPVRRTLLAAARQRPTHSERVLLVLGGSQGAAFLNRAVPEVLSRGELRDVVSEWKVIHQCGHGQQREVAERYSHAPSVTVEVVEFINDMPAALSDASAVITRGGAIALAEISEFRIRTIVVPLPGSAESHQWQNAQQAANAYGFVVVDEASSDAEQRLESAIRTICSEDSDEVAPLPCAGQTVAERIVDRLGHLAGERT